MKVYYLKEYCSTVYDSFFVRSSLKELLFIEVFFECHRRCLSYFENDFLLFDDFTFSKLWVDDRSQKSRFACCFQNSRKKTIVWRQDRSQVQLEYSRCSIVLRDDPWLHNMDILECECAKLSWHMFWSYLRISSNGNNSIWFLLCVY
jgi:hypothetical protein